MKGKEKESVSRERKPSLFARVAALVEEARQKVATVANIAQVYTNYEIGRQIVEEEQGGKLRAEYGSKILIDLSQKLTARFGRGWSVDNLEKMRRFFLLYSHVEISANPLRISHCRQISAKALRISQPENREGRTFSFFQGYQRSIPVRTVQLVSAINRSVSSYHIRLGVCLPALPRQSAARSRSWYRLVRHWQPLQPSAAQPL